MEVLTEIIFVGNGTPKGLKEFKKSMEKNKLTKVSYFKIKRKGKNVKIFEELK